jgi:hypothetical protein
VAAGAGTEDWTGAGAGGVKTGLPPNNAPRPRPKAGFAMRAGCRRAGKLSTRSVKSSGGIFYNFRYYFLDTLLDFLWIIQKKKKRCCRDSVEIIMNNKPAGYLTHPEILASAIYFKNRIRPINNMRTRAANILSQGCTAQYKGD